MAALSSIATAAIIGGAAVSAAGAVAQGNAAAGQAKFQAAVQRQQATHEREIAAGWERDFRRDQSALFAERRARMGATGVEGGTGSALLASEDFAREAELQALRIRAGGDVAATRLRQQAQLTRAGGQAAQAAGFMRAGSSLLTGAGRAFS